LCLDGDGLPGERDYAGSHFLFVDAGGMGFLSVAQLAWRRKDFYPRKKPMKKCSVVLMLLGVGLLGGCRTMAPEPSPEVAVMQSKVGLLPEKGMSRIKVESVLGEPAHESRTKDGLEYAMYTIASEPGTLVKAADSGIAYGEGFEDWRSVIYDRHGKVVDWYGFERQLKVEAAPIEPAKEEEDETE
jgi:hypothetical protein